MSGFLNLETFDVRRIDADQWRLLSPQHWVGTGGDRITLDTGFVTDFATSPWFTWWLIPKTGKWTVPATFHDQLCDLLNERWRLVQAHLTQISREFGHSQRCVSCRVEAEALVPPCVFGPVDTDGAFRAMCRDQDVDPIRRWLLWTGVRWGALMNPARRAGWWRTAHLVLPISVAVLAPVVFLLYLVVRGLVALC